jgi:translation elongation factor EF-1alpha
MANPKMEKLHIQIVIIGCAESGKSTTANHLIETCGGIDKKTTMKVDQDVTKVES